MICEVCEPWVGFGDRLAASYRPAQIYIYIYEVFRKYIYIYIYIYEKYWQIYIYTSVFMKYSENYNNIKKHHSTSSCSATWTSTSRSHSSSSVTSSYSATSTPVTSSSPTMCKPLVWTTHSLFKLKYINIKKLWKTTTNQKLFHIQTNIYHSFSSLRSSFCIRTFSRPTETLF